MSIVRRHRSHVALGVVTLAAALIISPSLAAWMSPTIAGIVLSIVLSWASGTLALGLALKRMGLLVTPEETKPPEIAARANALSSSLAAGGADAEDALAVIHRDARFREAHASFLPPAAPFDEVYDPLRPAVRAP